MTNPNKPPLPDTTNYRKYQTENLVVRLLIKNFYKKVGGLLDEVKASENSLLDAGCGEGIAMEKLKNHLPATVIGIDCNEAALIHAKKEFPAFAFQSADLNAIPFAENSFETVLCLEVLEHLPDPDGPLTELARVCRKNAILSVPYEPWFRTGSLLRGKYLRSFGNHPEHVNHWNKSSFRSFVESSFEVETVTVAFPWILVLCQKHTEDGGD